MKKDDLVSKTNLILTYSRSGLLFNALQVFFQISFRDLVLWNAVIGVYAEHGCLEESINCIERMQEESISPDAVSFISCLKACSSNKSIEKGQKLHQQVIIKGFLISNVVVGNSVVDMYLKCGMISKAHEVFNMLPTRDEVSWNILLGGYLSYGYIEKAQDLFDKFMIRNVVSWNALITGYIEYGRDEEALNSLDQMHLEGVFPTTVTVICCLKACSSCRAIDKGCEIHSSITQNGLLEKDLLIGTMLVDMYAKHGWLAEAKQVFDKLLVQNVISFTCLLAGYIEHGWDYNALKLFEQMELEGISPNNVTYMCILKSYKSLGSMDKIRRIHADIVKKGLLEEAGLK